MPGSDETAFSIETEKWGKKEVVYALVVSQRFQPGCFFDKKLREAPQNEAISYY